MKKSPLILLILLLIICTMAACSHSDPTIVYLNATLKQKYNFQKGSYWIYKDSLTGVEDSMVVISTTLEISSPSNNNIRTEGLRCDIRECDSKPDSVSSLFLISATEGSSSSFSFKVSIANLLNQGLGFPYLTYPFKNISYRSTLGDSIIITNIPTPYLLAGNNYDNVTQLLQASQPNLYYNNCCYINDSVGLIKIRTPYEDIAGNKQIKVLELQRWHIIK
jgi:hypothetical protein